jgi:integrase
VTFLFWTGALPSEASGLQWGDVDLKGKVVFVRRSFHLGVYAGAKTKRSVRRVQLTEELVDLLRELQPLRVEPKTPAFANLDATAIEPKAFSTHWYVCLRALGIRTRGL